MATVLNKHFCNVGFKFGLQEDFPIWFEMRPNKVMISIPHLVKAHWCGLFLFSYKVFMEKSLEFWDRPLLCNDALFAMYLWERKQRTKCKQLNCLLQPKIRLRGNRQEQMERAETKPTAGLRRKARCSHSAFKFLPRITVSHFTLTSSHFSQIFCGEVFLFVW